MNLIERDDARQLRQFGLTLVVMLPLVFDLLLPWFFGIVRPLWPLIASLVLLIVAVIKPTGLYWLYRGWMALAAVLGRITNTIVLGSMFFGIMVPLGVVLRRLNKLQYRVGFDSDIKSYRLNTRRSPDANDLKNPF